jgi:hypothetical protein
VIYLCTADVTKTHHTYIIQLKDSVESGGSEVEVGRFVSSEGFRHQHRGGRRGRPYGKQKQTPLYCLSVFCTAGPTALYKVRRPSVFRTATPRALSSRGASPSVLGGAPCAEFRSDDRGYFLDTNSDPNVCKFEEEERVNISNFLACTRERSYINY